DPLEWARLQRDDAPLSRAVRRRHHGRSIEDARRRADGRFAPGIARRVVGDGSRDRGDRVMNHPWDRRLGVWWIAEDHPELPAIAESPTNEALTFAELAARAHQVVHALRSRNINAGDVVVYALPNGVDTVVWQLAAQEAGLRYI